MKYRIDPERVFAVRDEMIYGQFLEHFHRQVYGGVYDPESKFADEDGFRTDVLEALKEIRVPIIRWPGGCFVSSYDWKKGVGKNRIPAFDKAWRVEDPNTFGTDEFIKYCEKLGCEPYICTNAGTGTEQEMSDWVEYCNLENEGEFARMRIANGHEKPYNVKYWSIGNENYGSWEIGAKDSDTWSRLVAEASKMMKHVSPDTELSAAALADPEWNFRLLTRAGQRLDWISIHGYWDMLTQIDNPADYNACMAFTDGLDDSVNKVRGMLTALGYDNIKIAFDEWNLRSWHHPNIHTGKIGATKEEYLYPRDRNDINATYTMADAVFTAVFLNMTLRHADVVRMANFSPVVNTRGMVFTHKDGIVKRSMYHVFKLYTQYMYDQVIDLFTGDTAKMDVVSKRFENVTVDQIDCIATRSSADGKIAVSVVNKHISEKAEVSFTLPCSVKSVSLHTVNGEGPDDYNDIGRDHICIRSCDGNVRVDGNTVTVTAEPHSVNVLTIE